MPAFYYKAKTKTGQVRSGTIEAASSIAARQQLRKENLFPLAVSAAAKRSFSFGKSNRVSRRDLLMLTTQLSIMNKSGVDLTESLKSVATQIKNPRLSRAVNTIVERIEDGAAFSEALQSQVEVFGETYVASIAAGEATGNLRGVLDRMTTLLRNEVRLWETIKSILTYPAVLMLVAVMVVNALIFFVLPQFGKVFDDLEKTPPATTQFLLAVSETLRTQWWLIPALLSAILIAVVAMIKSDRAKEIKDRLLLTLPGIGKAAKALLAGRTFRLIGTMIQSGIPVLEAVKLCRRSIRNQLYQKLFDNIEAELTRGNNLSIAIRQATFLPAGVAQMISTSERSGDLGGVMEIVGEYYEEEGERFVRELAKIIEPAIIVAMGGFVAVVVLSVILPLLDVTSAGGA